MISILLVEDNESITEGLRLTFTQAGYALTVAGNIFEAEAAIDRGGFGLVLLDVTLPDGNGFDFYRSELADRGVPVIFLTARDEENDIVKGLELGAEDYMTKPFSTRELLARVNRVLLRHGHHAVLTSGPIAFDVDKLTVTRGGERVELSSLELKILQLLFVNHDKVVRRGEVIDCIYEATGNDVYDHTVTVYLKRIREKLGADIITTIKGVGYRIDLGEEHS